MFKSKRVILFIVMIPVFMYSFFFTAATGSYLQLEDDWKEHTVFTSSSVTDPHGINEIDKVIYAFHIQPFISIVFIISLIVLASGLMVWIRNIIRRIIAS